MEYEGLFFLVVALVILAAQAAWKLWQRSQRTREALQLQREPWLTRFDAPGSAAADSGSMAAPKLLRRRRPAAVWGEPEGSKEKKDEQTTSSQASTGGGGLPSSEVVALPEDLAEIPGSSTALDSGEPSPPLDAALPSSELCSSDNYQETVSEPDKSQHNEEPDTEPHAQEPLDEAEEVEIEPQVEPQDSQDQVPTRRSISETLRAASAEEDPTEGTFDELLDHLEGSLMQVELSHHHAVLLKRAELHLLTLLGSLRDLLTRSLRSQSRHRTMELVGCARASRLRAVLEAVDLSPGRADDRLASCRAVCDAVDGVLADFGLQETLRQEQQERRVALQRALDEKRREEAELRKAREKRQAELRQAQLEQRQALTQALQTPNLEDAESDPTPKFTASSAAPDFARGDRCMLNWFLEFAEALLSEVLCFLDGVSLALLEMCSTWWRRLVCTKLSGVWRFVHLCALGAQPPMALARPPKGLGLLKGGGPWKQLWLARHKLLQEPDEAQRQVAFEQARLLLSPGSHAVVQPLKPSARFLQMIIQNCLPEGFEHDRRFGPLQKRWCSHLMVGVEAMVTHANGVQTNHEQLYMSWSVCFSAMQGLPRLFLASTRWGPAQGAWEVDLAECRLPPKAPLSWAAAAQEIHELRAQSRALEHGLCDATELCGFQFQGPQWRIQNPAVAPQEHWQRLYKDLFGLEQRELPGRGRAYKCLKLLLALTCPNPFAQEPQKLALALEGLRPHLED